MEKENQEKVDSMTVYEASYILLPSLAEEQVPNSIDFLKKSITDLGGAVISYEDPILIDLAYQITKVTTVSRTKVQRGYFGWTKFEIPEGIEKIKKVLDENQNVVRSLIIKTVRENTLLNGKMIFQKEEKAKREEDLIEEVDLVEPEKTPSDEVDKSIDELVIS